ncbi:MAG: CBS domain-containing protein [Euryarchaeota archaeon]|nr:CBS domain-containing protein [Euryarchaeota archaeon]
MKTGDVMSTPPLSLDEHEPATRARAMFREFPYRSFPVVSDGKLVGIVTRSDVLRITSSRSNIRVAGVMSTSVITTHPEEPLEEAGEKMVLAGVEHLPVVASPEDSTLVGMLSARDVMQALVEHGRKPRKATVSEVMLPPEHCDAQDSVSRVWARLQESELPGMPVLKDGRVVGVITRRDIIARGIARLSLEDEKGRKRSPRVEKLMSTPAVVVPPSEDVVSAAELMLARDISMLPVVEGESLAGVVHRLSILSAWF